MNLQISGVSGKEKKVIYLYFSEDKKRAEITLPDYQVVSNQGFSDEELEHLKDYAKENRQSILEQAKTINPISALMRSPK